MEGIKRKKSGFVMEWIDIRCDKVNEHVGRHTVSNDTPRPIEMKCPFCDGILREADQTNEVIQDERKKK